MKLVGCHVFSLQRPLLKLENNHGIGATSFSTSECIHLYVYIIYLYEFLYA